jgi:hypothetical protein
MRKQPAMELFPDAPVFLAGWQGARKCHARDYSDHRSYLVACRRIADVAVQHRMGVLPRRRARPHPDHRCCPCFSGTNLARSADDGDSKTKPTAINETQENVMGFGRGLLLWLLGIPLPIIILLAIFMHH